MSSWVRQHSLGLFLVLLFLAFTTTSLVTGWFEFSSEQSDHGQPVEAAAFWLWWVFEYTMSLVADVFGLLLIVFATKWLREIGSAESKDN
jgi:hypothetical protein